MPPRDAGESCARALLIEGQVQGVGFRPFVLNLARELGVCGSVVNDAGSVAILAQGDRGALDAFQRRLILDAPPLSRPRLASAAPAAVETRAGFNIGTSTHAERTDVHLVPDTAPCADCVAELKDPQARRFRYPFVNCTQCGPRYTIVHDLPYDRAATAMAGYAMCEPCRREYSDPADRRFHAQPLACEACGPRLSFVADLSGGETVADPIAAAAAALRGGLIVAVKGVGGYRVLCDARSEDAVAGLRARKRRPDKPFAVLFEDSFTVAKVADVEPAARNALASAARPIVLLPLRDGHGLAPSVAPRLGSVGAMLPSSPLDILLASAFDGPLVATSANRSGEPMLTDAADAEDLLTEIADAFLHHDRPIVRPADDPVVQVVSGTPCAIRLGRGTAPLELALCTPVPEPTLALGGQDKVTIALAEGDRVVISPHIGDLATPRARDAFARTIADFCAIHRIAPRRLVCDLHPGFASARWASRQGLPITRVQHHHAHASALAGEHGDVARWLVFTWDALGFVEDGTLWGGEAFLGRPGAWRRAATMRPFRLPGGERAAREPWRSAAAVCWETGEEWSPSAPGARLAREAWLRGLNTPRSSAVGRLFDAFAAIVLGIEVVFHEGAGPQALEAHAGAGGSAVAASWQHSNDGLLVADWAPLLNRCLDRAIPSAERAASVHSTFASLIADCAARFRGAVDAVGLTGGVFQNRVLAESACTQLAGRGIDVRLPSALPTNDGGLAFGQIVEAAATVRDG